MSKKDVRTRAREIAKLFDRLRSRMRLEGLASVVHQVSAEERELERLKYYYLPMWSAWCASITIERGAPSQVPFTDYMKGSMREFDETGLAAKIDAEACRLIDQAVNELAGSGNLHARGVLNVRYLNARVANVFRSGRLVVLDPEQADELCDHVERDLLPIVKRKGLLL